MRALALLLPMLAAACDSPTPAVARWNRATLEVGGMTFGVHWSADRAEAYRTSRHWLPDRAAVFARAAVAIRAASGCAVRELSGDSAIVTARLHCDGAPRAGPTLRVEPGDCVPGEVWSDGGGEVVALDCDLILTTR